MKIIGERVRKIRKKRSMTQEQLAKKVFVSKQVISNIERGVTSEVKNSIMNLLSYALLCRVEYLKGESDEPIKNENGLVEPFYFLPKWDYEFEIKELLKENSRNRDIESLLREEIYYLKNIEHTNDSKDVGVEILQGIVDVLNKEKRNNRELKILLDIIKAFK